MTYNVTQGIYRVAGAKSKMQSLCKSFENGLNLVELNDKSPHLISSVLKLYLRQVDFKMSEKTKILIENLIQLIYCLKSVIFLLNTSSL